MSLEEISQKEKDSRPIGHEKNTHLGKSCITMTYLMVKFYEKISLVMLYVKNDPSQAVEPVKQVLKTNNQY